MTTGLPEQFTQALSDSYRIERELGAGGMATVFLAEDVKHHRQVAIKVLRDDLTASLGAERFVREISIAAGLTHPHILPLHDSGEAGKRLFYVMPYVEGQSLRQKLRKEGELPIGEAVRILRDVADAMAHAHGRGVVHRDLKPENIMLSGRHALVTDFGVAKALSEATGRQTLTTAGVALGTPSYMSPEQATADPHTDHRSDIYSFGVMAYELLTGQTPFGGRSPQEVLAAHVTSPVVPVTNHRATIPPALAALVMQCLEKKPADRPQSAEQLVPVLEGLLTPSGGVTPTATAPYVGVASAGAARSSRGVVRVAVGVVVVAVAAFAAFKWNESRGIPGPRVRSPVVVLPFEVQGGDKSLEPLGVQVAEQASAAIEAAGLGRVVALPDRITGAITPSVMRSALRATKAGTLVTGVIATRGADVEITARVVRAYDLQTVWTLGPERAPQSNAAQAADSIRQRILGAIGVYVEAKGDLLASNASLYPPPPTLEAYRLTSKADEYFRTGSQLRALPLLQQAFALDTTWLSPVGVMAAIYFNAGRWRERDSVTAFLEARRGRLSRGQALGLDQQEALEKSPEEELRATLALHAADSAMTYLAMWSSVRAQHPAQALRFYAMRDTTGNWGRDWQAWSTVAAQAYHQLGKFEDELALARAAKSRSPRTYGHWAREVTALAAMGKGAAVDDVIRGSATLEYVPAPVALLSVASAEFRSHGFDSLAHAFAERTLVGIEGWTDSLKKTILAVNNRRGALGILGRNAEALRIYDADARAQGAGGLGNRILGARYRILMGDTTGVLALVDSAKTQPLNAFAGSSWSHTGQPMYYASHLLSLLGRKDEAVALLRESLNNGWRLNQQVTDEARQWYWAPIRDYPPFKEVVKIHDEK